MIRRFFLFAVMCSLGLGAKAQVAQWAQTFRQTKGIANAHSGICIYEPSTGKYLYQYQDDKYFAPASNIKIMTTYTALKLLGDSLPAFRYAIEGDTLYVQGSADPSFLHPVFSQQRAFEWLRKTDKHIALVPALNENLPFGPGWSWEDYETDYQPERNEWPMYGDVVQLFHRWKNDSISPAFFNRPVNEVLDNNLDEATAGRAWRSNQFYVHYPARNNKTFNAQVPYITGDISDLRDRLVDTLKRPVTITPARNFSKAQKFYSRPVDSVLRPMMFESDDLMAEQMLMECSNQLLDTISSQKVIDYMLANSLKGLPHPPHWVDGSGLSRYNMFTPGDIVMVLDKLTKEFPKSRVYSIFPTAGQGTLGTRYAGMAGAIYAKTGSFGNCFALSGYLITRKGKTLIFSVMVNMHNDKNSNIRSAVEQFVTKVYENY